MRGFVISPLSPRLATPYSSTRFGQRGRRSTWPLAAFRWDELSRQELDLLGTNDVTAHWFNADYALQWPNDDTSVIYLAPAKADASPFRDLLIPVEGNFWRVELTSPFGLPEDRVRDRGGSTLFRLNSGLMSLFNYDVSATTLAAGEPLLRTHRLVPEWRFPTGQAVHSSTG